MADEPSPVAPAALAGGTPPDPQVPEVRSRRGRKFLRLFLMTAGGLAAPCLALAAFFLSNSGGGDTPAAKSSVVQPGQVTTTTKARPPVPAPIATTTTTTTTTLPPPGRPPRDPFAPLVTQAPSGTTAR
ncbi:MAG TPA: hypothetical protein VG034_21400 [Acidimicrobiia bacterium]|jgi:hypothetical protein|nr:hypothetical protein [Acidimicrobiia bacterium]